MIRWKVLVAPLLAGLLSYFFVGINFWDGTKQAFLVSLSVIAAGALVRLARGFPFTSPDHYEVEEVRDLAQAVEKIIRALRALIIVVLATMVLLVLAKPALTFIPSVLPGYQTPGWIEGAISGALGFALAYVFTRMVHVVQGDYDLTILQSKFVVRAVERRQAKAFDELEKKGSATQFVKPENYGKKLD